MRAKFEHFDVLAFEGNKTCQRVEEINIRGQWQAASSNGSTCETQWMQLAASGVPAHIDTNSTCDCSCPELCGQVSHGLQLQSLWRIPTAAVS